MGERSDRAPTLSVVIVNYNTRDDLRRCLASISTSGPSPETIVVDNGSRDDSVEMLKREFPAVRLIENGVNLGFARANNRGIAVARGRFVLLLNSDTEVIGDALDRMVEYLDADADAGVVSARVVYPDFTDQGVARRFPTPMNALFGRRSVLTRLFPNNRYARRYLLSRQETGGAPFEVDWVSGACLMARRGVLEEVGGLDGKFFMYWEDADLCRRIRDRGWKVVCVPRAVVVHHEGRSTPRRSARMIVEFNRSAYRYWRKHHVKSSLGASNLCAIMGTSMRALLQVCLNQAGLHVSRRSRPNSLAAAARKRGGRI